MLGVGWGGGGATGSSNVRPSTESVGRNGNKKKDDKKSRLRRFRRRLKDPTLCPHARAVLLSSLLTPSFSLFVLLPSLIV